MLRHERTREHWKGSGQWLVAGGQKTTARCGLREPRSTGMGFATPISELERWLGLGDSAELPEKNLCWMRRLFSRERLLFLCPTDRPERRSRKGIAALGRGRF